MSDFTPLQVLASNMIFLGVVIFVPFSFGRIILYYMSWLFSSASGGIYRHLITFEGQENSMLGHVAEAANSTSASLSADLLKGALIGTSRLSDVTTLAIGYMFIFSLVFFYLGIVALIRYTKGEPLTMGRFYGIASIAKMVPSLFRQFLAAMKHLMTMIKVAFLLVIELGVFPLLCGWWLDVCTIRMFGKTMSQRVQFFSVSPLASSLVHWVVGIVYMLQISIFVSLLRVVTFRAILLWF